MCFRKHEGEIFQFLSQITVTFHEPAPRLGLVLKGLKGGNKKQKLSTFVNLVICGALITNSRIQLSSENGTKPTALQLSGPPPCLAAFAGRFSLCRGAKDGRIPNLTPNVLRAPLGFPDSRWANICAQWRFKSGKVETWGKKCHAIETAKKKSTTEILRLRPTQCCGERCILPAVPWNATESGKFGLKEMCKTCVIKSVCC